MAKNDMSLGNMQHSIWQAKLCLEISLSPAESRLYDQGEPYLISVPRLSYLPFLLPRLLNYFAEDLITDIDSIPPDTGYFTFEDVPLKWHLPVGLLYDTYVLSTQDVNQDEATYRGSTPRKATEPFKLRVHFTPPSDASQKPHLINPTPEVVHDAFINSVKEADFLRSGSAKPIMSLSATDSKLLWTSTQDNNVATFSRIHASLLPNSTPWRNIPLRVYLPSTTIDPPSDPSSPTPSAQTQAPNTPTQQQQQQQAAQPQGHIRVIQSQIPPYISPSSTSIVSSTATTQATTTPQPQRLPTSTSHTPQTVGTALHSLLPSLFPSRRTPILAKPLLHGAVVPMGAGLEDLARSACYADGWVNIVVAVTG